MSFTAGIWTRLKKTKFYGRKHKHIIMDEENNIDHS